jgi:colanic acid/amylovoran biosynthesis glycosyltransferase
MKIAFIVNSFPALSETFILNQMTGLLDRGHEVDIYANRPRGESRVHADVDKYGLVDHTYYMTPDSSQLRSRISRLGAGLWRIAMGLSKNPRAVLSSLNVVKFGKESSSLRILYQMSPFLAKGPYDIVHCHFGPNGQLAIRLKDLGALHGPIVTTFYGYDISSYVKKMGQDTYNTLFQNGDLFLCVSEQMKRTLIRLGCEASKIIVHRLGVDLRRFQYVLRPQKTCEKIQLLTISRLVEKKGVEYGIQSVAKVLKKYPNIEYKIAGDGQLKNTLQILIEDLKVSGNIKLLGWQVQEQIVGLLQEADILLAPSVTSGTSDCEGIPVAIVEALARGLPVVSTLHSGIPEAVLNGESGFLVHERDVDALAEKLDYLIEHPQLRPEMGRKGRKYVEEHYDLDKLNDRLVEIYRRLLEGKLPDA